jgi:hypothetical protein
MSRSHFLDALLGRITRLLAEIARPVDESFGVGTRLEVFALLLGGGLGFIDDRQKRGGRLDRAAELGRDAFHSLAESLRVLDGEAAGEAVIALFPGKAESFVRGSGEMMKG